MKKDVQLLLYNAACFIISAIAIIIIMIVMHIDISIVNSYMSEESFTEAMQELTLLAIIAIYARMAWKNQKMRPAFVLIAGFFACMFWREMDYWFGLMGFHWLPLVVVTAGACIYYAARQFEKTVHGLARFSQTKSFVLVMAGILTILVFSRLYGMKIIWIGLMGENYERWVKIFAEEGLELFGYTLCLLGSIFYALNERRNKKRIIQP